MNGSNDDWHKSKDWLRFRRHWLKNHSPVEDKWYLCGICGRWIPKDEVTLDHIEPRTPQNMFSEDNIQPAHGYCNYAKGSRRIKPVVEKETYNFIDVISKM